MVGDEVAGRAVRLGRGRVFGRQQPPLAPRDLVEAGVGGDLVEPGAQRAEALEPVESPRQTRGIASCIASSVPRGEPSIR